MKNDRYKYAKIFNGHFSYDDVINPKWTDYDAIKLDLSFLMIPCLLKSDHSLKMLSRFSSEVGGHWP